MKRYKNVLKTFHHVPMLHQMGTSSTILGLLKDIGLEEPSIAVRPVVHVIAPDLKIPHGYHLTPPHQDWTFVQGSIDSVTIWIPLMDVPVDHHPLQVWPGSHKKGLLEYRAFECGQEVLPEYVDENSFVSVPVKAGDAICFSSLLVHKTSRQGRSKLTLLPKSGPGGSSPMRPDRWSYLSWPVPASGSRCSSGAVVG